MDPMRSRVVAPQEFQAVRDAKEQICWTGRPACVPFILRTDWHDPNAMRPEQNPGSRTGDAPRP